MNAIRRSPSSCLELTRMWRSTERASLEKKPSMRLSHEPCVGVKVKVKRPMGCAASDRLDPGFLVVRDYGEAAAVSTLVLLLLRAQQRHLPVACSAKILQTVPWASLPRLGCP